MSFRRLPLATALFAPLLAAPLAATSCTRVSEPPAEPAAQATALESLAKRTPAIARWTARSRGPSTSTLRARGLTARADARGVELRRDDDPRAIRIRRDGDVRTEGGTLVHASAGRTAITFVDAGGIEDLVQTDGDLEYALELPEGVSLRAPCGACELAELRDARGKVLLRIAAPIAWDARGAARTPRIELLGRDRLRVVVDAEAPRPLLVDPRWTTPALPALPRRGHATTPLGDGRLLLTGGGSAVTEIYDPTTGELTLGPTLSTSRFFHTATLLADGRVLVAGGETTVAFGPPIGTTELIDVARGQVVAGPALGTARGEHTATMLSGGDVLLAGGNGASGALASTELFVAATGTLKAGATLRAARARHTATLLPSGQVALIGGVLDAAKASTELVDATGATTIVGPQLLERRRNHATNALPDGRLLVIGGDNELGSFSSTELCPAGTGACVAGPALAQARVAPRVTLLPDDTAAVSGGYAFGTDSSLAVRTTELLTATTRTTVVPDPLVAHLDHTATPLPSGASIVFGGDDATIDQLVPDRQGFAAAATPYARAGAALVALRTGEVLALGGIAPMTTTPTNLAAYWSPTTGGWTLTASMTQARAAARALALDDGRVLVVGSDGGAAASTAELYDRATGTFAPIAGGLSEARARPTLTRLPSGKILVAGGGTASAELFDPGTGAFTKTGSMTRARGDHAAVLLRDGRVLIAGGTADGVAEVYRPDGTFAALAAPMGHRPDCRGVLLPSGRVLLTGGTSRQGELFDPIGDGFTPTALAADAHREGALSILPTGAAIVAGGRMDDPYAGLSSAEVFEPGAADGLGGFVAAPPMTRQRIAFGAALLDDGRLMHAPANECPMCPNVPGSVDLFAERPTATARPTIAAAPSKATVGAAIDLTGTGFVATPEPTDGTTGGAARTPPIGVFVPLAGDAALFGRTLAWTATTMRWEPPSSARLGPGRLFVLVRGAPSKAAWITLEASPQAAGCAADAACATGHCVDGVCCDRACDGLCEACSAARKGSGADGVCGAIPPEKDAGDACVLGLGAKCTSAAQCATGQCVDGVCCNAACAGQCEACDVEGSFGTCVPTSGAPHGARAACAGASSSDACTARVCDGVARASCDGYVGSAVSCRAASCAAGTATRAAKCDGSGACPAAVTSACAPYACDGDACRTGGCAADAECGDGYRCAIAALASRGDCVVRTDAYCADDRTSVSRDGTTRTCDPYRCTPTGCATSCASSDDCLGGFVCDTASKACVAGSSGGAGDSGGCSSSGAAGPASSALAVLALAALGLARRARR